ncbi:glycoside hydrolase family 31 protein [Microbacterium sp. 179-I 1D1 NHS]|uniref:glycoside hydrolase family 31 protein n=1 Tax=Microbacterium sp. 179-I 1D1 NHS TaxID=3374298 RepID=UPI003879936B
MTLSAPRAVIDDGLLRPVSHLELPLEDGERWWGGCVDDGRHMPFGVLPFARDLGTPEPDADDPFQGRPSNQSAPLLLSTSGRVVWSDEPFSFAIRDGSLHVAGSDLSSYAAGSDLRDAFIAASRRHFPPSGTSPASELFSGPQYNTWIEQPYRPTQESTLAYAKGVLEAGMPPGVLFIDDSWSPDYGTLEFDAARFPDPAAMVTQLHQWGFRVMLWLVPFVSPDSATFRELEGANLLVRGHDGRTAVRRWWNGLSALLDASNAQTVEWLTGKLDRLVRDVGVDGFKFDGGDVRDYRADDLTAGGVSPVEHCEAWAAIGLRYPFNEYRACWRMGGQPLAQRLQDKPPTWDANGIGSLIPEMLAQGMIGHPFICPDMIGGGEIGAVSRTAIDQEFFVRYAQIAALSPMAQFSIAPHRVLDAVHLEAVKSALALRERLLPRLLDLVQHAAVTGEPILRPMAYHCADAADVVDQFFIGADIVAAPIVHPGATTRTVFVPAGRWVTGDGERVSGPGTLTVPVDLATIPILVRDGRDD